MTFEELMQAVQKRTPQRWGIRSAHDYLSGIQSCAGDPVCAAKFFGIADSASWEKALEESKARLVYSDDDMAMEKASVAKTDKSVLDFSAILTSTRRDRDFDVLETRGAKPDLKMALLWQHVPFEPIGKMVAVLRQTNDLLVCHFAVADTLLGRDAATLVEFGALRMSHGFRPEEAEPLDAKDGMGWRVTKFEIIEASVVSIPSNTDAVITAVSREKLHHPAVEKWAKSAWDAKPASVVGGFSVTEKLGDHELTLQAPSLDGLKSLQEQVEKKTCACEAKPPEAKAAETKANVMLEGSWDSIYSSLAKSLETFLIGKGLMSPYQMAFIEAMFDQYGICCVSKSAGNAYYRANWKMNQGNAPPSWDGDPQEVKISAEIEDVKAKMFKRIESAMFVKVLEGDLPDELLELVCQAGKRHEAALQKRAQRKSEQELEALLGIV